MVLFEVPIVSQWYLNCCTELYYYLSNRVGGEDNFFDYNRCDEFGNSAKRFTQGEMHMTSPTSTNTCDPRLNNDVIITV